MTRVVGAVRWSHSVWRLRRAAAIGCLVLAIAGCGGGEISLTEYVESINDAVTLAGARAEELMTEGVLGADTTPEQIAAGLRRGLDELRIPLQEEVDAIVPPEQVSALHALLWGWHADLIRIEASLADRMKAAPDTEEGWRLLSDSPEMAAYRESIAEGKQVCIDFQARLDATEARGAFRDVPWVPRDLSEVVNAALGCEWFPDDPESIYRYPPP